MAPGTAGAAELVPAMELQAGAVMRNGADLALMGRAGDVGLLADPVCWIVNDVVSRWMADVELEAAPVVGAGIPGAAALPVVLPLTADAGTAPAVPAAFRRIAAMELDGTAETVLSTPVPGRFTVPMGVEAGAGAAPSVPAVMRLTEALPGLTARTGSGAPDPAAAGVASGLSLAAAMLCWAYPEWVDPDTLYIRYVYSTERDGDTLVLH